MSDIRKFRPERRGGAIQQPLEIIEGILYDDLLAAPDVLVNPSTATAHEIKWDAGDNFHLTGQTFIVTNRDDTFSLASGRKVTCARLQGEWRPVGSGGGSNESIDYEVIEAGCPAFAAGQSQWVYAVVLRVDCQNTVEPGDVVQIFDPDENKFNLPVDRLVGARGVAHLRRNDGFTNIVCAVVPEPYGDCVWIVATIDCREEVYSPP